MARDGRIDWRVALAFLLPLAAYLALPTTAIGGDGLGYYQCVRRSDWAQKFSSGHLLYCPSLTLVTDALAPVLSVDRTMVLVNQVAGAASVALLYVVSLQAGATPMGAGLAAAGLAVSHGFWIQATDIETYMLAVFGVIVSLSLMLRYIRQPTLPLAAALGAANGAAAVFHLSTVTLVAASLPLIWWRDRSSRRWWYAAAVYAGGLGLVFGVPLLFVATALLDRGVLETPAFLLESRHRYRVVFDVLSLPRALYGFARTFVFLERFYQGPYWSIALKALALTVAAAWLAWQAWRRVPWLPGHTRVLLASTGGFLVLQAALGVYFFPSDSERWIFAAPVIWLATGVLVPFLSRRAQISIVAGVALLASTNFAQSAWPASRDHAVRDAVLALDARLPPRTLVITTGQDWMARYEYFTGRTVQTITLVDLAFRHTDDHEGFNRALDEVLHAAQAAGQPVLLLRVLDPDDRDWLSPWPEMRAVGHGRGEIRDWFTRRGRWREERLNDPARTRIDWLEPGTGTSRSER